MPDMTDMSWMDLDEKLKEWLDSDNEDTKAEDGNTPEESQYSLH